MKKLKVNFVDFWPYLYKTDNYFYNLLSLKYDVEIDEKNPDVLFFSVDYENTQQRHKYKDCLKIFIQGKTFPRIFKNVILPFPFKGLMILKITASLSGRSILIGLIGLI